MDLIGQKVISDKFGTGRIIMYFQEKVIDNLVVRFDNLEHITVSYSYPKCLISCLQIVESDIESIRSSSCLYNSEQPHYKENRKENIVLPTCSEEGHYENVTFCIICNKEIQRNLITIPKVAHVFSKPQKRNIIDSTCISEGSYELFKYCTVCGFEYTKTIITSKIQHNVDNVTIEYVPPQSQSIIKRKNITKSCSVCEKKIYQSYIDEHINTTRQCKPENLYFRLFGGDEHVADLFPEEKKYTFPTCQENGYAEYVLRCSHCNKILRREYRTIFPSDHVYREYIENRTNSTCISEGKYDIVNRCSYCNTEQSRKTVITKKTEHESEFVTEIISEPTSFQKGQYDVVHRCPTCKKEYGRVHYSLPKLLCHQPVYDYPINFSIEENELYNEYSDHLSGIEKFIYDSMFLEGMETEIIKRLPIYNIMKGYGFEYRNKRFVFIGR